MTFKDPAGGEKRIMGVVCPVLQAQVLQCVRQQFPALLARTAKENRELAGVIIRTGSGRVLLREFEGRSGALSVDPLCVQTPALCQHAPGPGLHRQRTHQLPNPEPGVPTGVEGGTPSRVQSGETLLGEFHSHPTVSPLAPPSAPDLYQLVLAASQEHHNCSCVLAEEGIYLCRVLPSACDRVHRDLLTFLRANKVNVDDALSQCDQPRLDFVSRMKEEVPHLWSVMLEPMEAYDRLNKATAVGSNAIESFCNQMRDLGLDIVFYPAR